MSRDHLTDKVESIEGALALSWSGGKDSALALQVLHDEQALEPRDHVAARSGGLAPRSPETRRAGTRRRTSFGAVIAALALASGVLLVELAW